MREIEQLKKQWNDGAQFRGIQANLHLDSDGLTLGASTVVAKRNHDGSLALDGEEAKVLTLLSVAHGQAIDPTALKTLRRASAVARDGDECKAAMHIALAKLPRIADPADAARRLFIADGLIAAGVAPRDIWNALEYEPAILESLTKYDQNEPRVPAGSGKPSGEWTSDGGRTADIATAVAAATAIAPSATRTAEAIGREIETQAPRVLSRLPGVAARLAGIAARLNLVLSAAIETVRASATGGDQIVGRVSGYPNWQYSRYLDETALQLADRRTGRTIATLYPTGVRGQYADQTGVIAQMEGDELVLRSATNAASQAETQKKEPQLCPEPKVPDYKGMVGPRGDRSREYEAIMRGRTNPDDPTPPGMAYGLVNPVTGDLIKFDDCEHPTGDMMEYKGHGLADLLLYEPSRTNVGIDMVKEATNQVLASGGRHLVWNFAELPTMEYARTLFQANPLLAGIELRYEPWPEGANWKWSRAKNQWLRSIRRLWLRKHLVSAGRHNEYRSF